MFDKMRDVAGGMSETLNDCGDDVRPAFRAIVSEAVISLERVKSFV